MEQKDSLNDKLGLTCLVLGFLSFFLGPLASIPGIILGHLSVAEENLKKLAIVGLVLNYFTLLCVILIFLVFIFSSSQSATPEELKRHLEKEAR